MNSIVACYDADAADYARYWAPVLESTARQLLDVVDEVHGAAMSAPPGPDAPRSLDAPRILDVGAGTGSLALAALARWPSARVVLSDAAAGMLDFARDRATTGDSASVQLAADDLERLEFIHGPADALPIPDASIDVAISSFVLQLVPDRLAALTEILRVLKPGGILAYVTWLDRDARQPFVAAEEFDEAVYDLEIDEPEFPDEPHAGDVRSGRAAADELRRAGFTRASAREELLVYEWDFDSYLDYKLAYDERALLSWLSDAQRAELERNARRRLSTLAPTDFHWHAPVVFAKAFRQA